VTASFYEGWAYDDLEEAREDTHASWEYVERKVFRCRKCHYEWVESGATRRPPKLPPKPTPAPISIDELGAGSIGTKAMSSHRFAGKLSLTP
jgi:hypothetical protein